MSVAETVEVVLAGWVGLSVVLGLAVGRAFAAGQARPVTPGVREDVRRSAASPALRP